MHFCLGRAISETHFLACVGWEVLSHSVRQSLGRSVNEASLLSGGHVTYGGLKTYEAHDGGPSRGVHHQNAPRGIGRRVAFRHDGTAKFERV